MYNLVILSILWLFGMICPVERSLTTQNYSFDPLALTMTGSDTVNVLDWGAKGDGVTDDQEAIQKALQYCVENRKVCYVPNTGKPYLVKSTVRVPLAEGQKITIFSNHAVIKPVFPFRNNSLAHLTAFKEQTVLSVGPHNLGKKAATVSNIFDNNKNITATITGLQIDGSNLPPIAVPQDFRAPIIIGMAVSAEDISISNCLFENIFGDGIMAMGPGKFDCKNNTFRHVGGRGKTPYAYKVDNDHFGDAINISAVKGDGNILIASCNMTGYKLQGRRSRCGITFNFSNRSYKTEIKNCNISSYAKCIHVEEKTAGQFNVVGCTFQDFSYGVANVNDSGAIFNFSHCKINISGNDRQDAAGAALLGLNYSSNAKLNFYNTTINFNQAGVYQSVAPVRLFDHCIFNANHSNIFFADADTLLFNQCTFNGFGGRQKSFYACCGRKMNVTIKDSYFENSGPVTADDENVRLKVLNTPSLNQ